MSCCSRAAPGITAFTAFLEDLTPDAAQSVDAGVRRPNERPADLSRRRRARARDGCRRSTCPISSSRRRTARPAGELPAGRVSVDARLAATRAVRSRRTYYISGPPPMLREHRRRICAPATFLRRRFTLTPGNSRLGASPSFWRDRPVFVTGATGLVGGWLVRHLLDAGADVVVPGPRLGAALGARRRRADRAGQGRSRRRARSGDARARAGRVRNRDRLPSGGADDGRRGEPESGLDARHEHPRHVGAARGLPAQPDRAADRHRFVRQGLRRSGGAAVHGRRAGARAGIRTTSASRARTCWRRCTRRATACPVCVTRCGNFYGGGDLNWNRLVPGTIRSVAPRRAAGDSIGRPLHPRLPLRRGRRARVHAAGRAAGRAARARAARSSTSPTSSG